MGTHLKMIKTLVSVNKNYKAAMLRDRNGNMLEMNGHRNPKGQDGEHMYTHG